MSPEHGSTENGHGMLTPIAVADVYSCPSGSLRDGPCVPNSSHAGRPLLTLPTADERRFTSAQSYGSRVAPEFLLRCVFVYKSDRDEAGLCHSCLCEPRLVFWGDEYACSFFER